MPMIGADKVINDLEKLSSAANIKDTLQNCCFIVERDAKKNCPVQTGELRASITSQIIENGDEIQGEVGTPLMYGNYVEYGTGLFSSNGHGRTQVPWWYKNEKDEWVSTCGQMPQPFLIPALNNNRQEIIEQLKGVLKL